MCLNATYLDSVTIFIRQLNSEKLFKICGGVTIELPGHIRSKITISCMQCYTWATAVMTWSVGKVFRANTVRVKLIGLGLLPHGWAQTNTKDLLS